MREQPVYLDSSSISKRYVKEKGSDLVDRIYGKAEAGELRLAFSLWNIGEAIGVLDRYLTRRLISKKEFTTARSDLISETLKLSRLDSLDVLPVTSAVLSQSWTFITKHHIYEADALQISSGKEVDCGLFLTADNRLLEAALAEGLNAVNVESAHRLEL
jgi:predicted nucleic acid-binding protein